MSSRTEELLTIAERRIIELEAENKQHRDKLNAINDFATRWQEEEVGPNATWAVVYEIYKLSLLPEEKEAT